MIGLDTETQDGKCVLICSPNTSFEPWSWESICDYLFDLVLPGTTGFMFYNLTFDAQAMFCHLDEDTQWRLARLNKWEKKPYKVIWIPGKELTIWRDKKRVKLYDCWQYFRMGLDKAAKKYLGVGKLPLLDIDITRIAEALAGPHKTAVIDYCQRDALLCEQLWDLVESGLHSVDAETRRPISPAYLAGRFFLRKHKRPDARTNAVFHKSYFGGRIEMFQRGTCENLVAYDINSAYPTQAAKLPHAADLTQVIGRTPHADAVLGSYYVKIKTDPSTHVGPVPVKNHGTLIYPTGEFFAWVDLATLRMLEKQGWLQDVLEAFEFHPKTHISEPRLMFPRIPELYKLRKSSTSLDVALKWLLNGLYGKTAQNDRTWVMVDELLDADMIERGYYLALDEKAGWHQDYPYASAITGGARMQLLEAMLIRPYDVVHVATDSVWSREKLDLDIGGALGQWGAVDIDAIMTIMCGVYWYHYTDPDTGEGKAKSRFRGFSAGTDLRELIISVASDTTHVGVDCNLPLSMLWSLRTRTPINKIGTWMRELDLNGDNKRIWPNPVQVRDLLYTNQYSWPHLLGHTEDTNDIETY